jgi:RNA polymerase sigma factor (sigma-70 family)
VAVEWDRFFVEHDPRIRIIVGWPKWRFEAHVQEDLAQTIRGEIVRCIENLRDRGQAAAFVRRICVNRCIDEVRRQVRERRVLQPLAVQDPEGRWHELDAAADPEPDPAAAIILAERAAALRRLLDSLDECCLRMVRRFYVAGESYADMARQEGIAINTVGSRLSRCLERLRQMAGADPALGLADQGR